MLRTNNLQIDTAQLTSRIQAELQVPRRTVAPAPAPAVPAQAAVLSTLPDAVAATAAPPVSLPSESQSFRHKLRDVPLVGSLLTWAWGLARLADTRSAAHTALTRASDAWNFAAAQEPWVKAREAQLRGHVEAGLQECLGQIQGTRTEIQELRADSERDVAVIRVEVRRPLQEIATLRSEIEQVRVSLAEHRQTEQRLEAELEQLRAALQDHRQVIETALDNHWQAMEIALDNHRKATETALDEHRQSLEARFQAALSGEAAAREAALSVEAAARHSAEQESRHRLAALRQEVLFQQRRLSASLDVRGTAAGHQDSGAGPSAAAPREGAVDDRLNAFYAQFEDSFRGSQEDIKARVSVHADRIVLAGAGTPERPVLDIGCGRGEWLEVLREHGLAAYGIDSNDVTVSACRARGLDARRAEALGHLRSLADGSIGGVTAFHVAEHLPLDVLADLLDETLRVLEPGGVLLLETPNPENLLVGGMTFYNDPTHRNPLPPAVLQFLVRQRGFVDAEIVRLHPFPDDHLLPQDDVIGQRLNQLLYGPQDYAVVARKV